MADSTLLDLQEHITRIDRAIAETAKYAAEQRELEAEARKLDAEAQLFDRNRWQIVVAAMTAGAALFGAGTVFVKLLIG
jgi:hypothetical protein